MATENPQQPAMEDILTSIRTGVEEETAKVGGGSADLIDAAAAQDGEEDVLELSADDIVTPAGDADDIDELIDIAAFAQSGEAKVATEGVAVDLADESVATPKAAEAVTEGAADEFDRLLAEISQEQQQQVAASEVTKQALMDEEEPLGTEELVDEVDAADEGAEPDAIVPEELEEAVVAETVAAIAPVAGGAKNFKLGTVDGPDGVQVAFPAEVLAMALRPMVQEWLAQNLPSVVERLVKDEISKLTQN